MSISLYVLLFLKNKIFFLNLVFQLNLKNLFYLMIIQFNSNFFEIIQKLQFKFIYIVSLENIKNTIYSHINFILFSPNSHTKVKDTLKQTAKPTHLNKQSLKRSPTYLIKNTLIPSRSLSVELSKSGMEKIKWKWKLNQK